MNDSMPESPLFRLARAEALVFRVPIEQPVQTSFGIMHDRPAVLIRIEDDQGGVGWGEAWCNFPSVGAEHRARVFESCVAPILLEQPWPDPQTAFQTLSRRLHVLALQCGEPGTFSQVIAGADIALWDLLARRLRQPLWRLLGGRQPDVGVYASGLNPTEPEQLAQQRHAQGYRAFKLKVGFGAARDVANLARLRACFGDETELMVDANQAWSPDQALSMASRLAASRPAWLEEPLVADTPIAQWRALAAVSPIPLAAGENLRGDAQFDEAIQSGAFAVLQPDIGKWGGLSAGMGIARRALAQGRMLCPHWLGGGIGLVASMHLKCAVGGAGYVEVDANPNPMRELLTAPMTVVEGRVTLPAEPGLGVAPDLDAAAQYRVSVPR